MNEIVIPAECKTIIKGSLMYCIEPTYRDDGEGGVILGQHQTKFNAFGKIIDYEHFECERVRWQ